MSEPRFSLWRECWWMWAAVTAGGITAHFVFGRLWADEIDDISNAIFWITIVVWIKRDRLMS